MQFKHPHTIENGTGEKLIFKGIVKEPDGDRLEVENYVLPNAGPPMHVHFKQDEALTVVQGRMGTQVLGEEPKYLEAGESAIFNRGVPHKFWNAGTEPLICTGWVKPADNMEYFLTEIYKSMDANGGQRPGAFDAAWLLNRYGSEYDMLEIPAFVKKVIFPIALFFGKLTGKHRKFDGAPPPLY